MRRDFLARPDKIYEIRENYLDLHFDREYLSFMYLEVGRMKVEIHPSSRAAGTAAARAAGEALVKLAQTRETIGVIFATGASQLDTLEGLTEIETLPWNRVLGFHMDEYVGIAADHPASFRRYLRDRLTSRVQMKGFFEIDGSAPHPDRVGREYADNLRLADPQLCLLGIGENGHLAFNDPPVADFNDTSDARTVHLEAMCRQQQAAEGWFTTIEQVPEYAITLTIPTLMRVPKLIVSVPGIRKAQIVRRAFQEPISTECPATILRTHPDVTIYLDVQSAAELSSEINSQ
jgi:glucosamine-6-phosphate deaminase